MSKKIAVIMPNTLPMPAVKGGAVENILQNLIDYNEHTHKFLFTIFCKYDIEAYKASKSYQYTSFEYIDDSGLGKSIEKYILGAINQVFNYKIGNIYIREIVKRLRLETYDFAIIENAPYYIPVISNKLKYPVYLHVHNDYTSKMKKIVNEKCSHIICVSDFIKETYKKYKIYEFAHVLYNCIDLERFSYCEDDRKNLRAKYAIRDSEKVFIYSGRLVQGKGVFELIKGFNKAIKINEEMKLFIVGGVTFSSNIKDEYYEKCLLAARENKNIIFTGYVDYSELHKYYSMADIGVIPSLFLESANLSAIEMMSSGLPIIASDSAGLGEMARFGNHVFIYNTNNQMEFITQIKNAILEGSNLGDRVENKYNLNVFSVQNYEKEMRILLNMKE